MITRFRGDTKPIIITLYSDAGPLDLIGCSGFTLTADQSKEPIDSTNNIFVLNGTILSAPDGMVEFLITPSQANHIGTFYFDVQYLDVRGMINTVGKEILVLVQDISK